MTLDCAKLTKTSQHTNRIFISNLQILLHFIISLPFYLKLGKAEEADVFPHCHSIHSLTQTLVCNIPGSISVYFHNHPLSLYRARLDHLVFQGPLDLGDPR